MCAGSGWPTLVRRGLVPECGGWLGGAVPWRPLPRLVAVPGTRASRAAAAALEVTSPCLASDQG